MDEQEEEKKMRSRSRWAIGHIEAWEKEQEQE